MTVIRTKCVLFDMDGTLVDSTPGVIQAWKMFSLKYGLDAVSVTQATHGMRLMDSLRKYCGITDEAVLRSEVDRFESEVLAATRDGQGLKVLPGVHALINQLTCDRHATPRWTIVTSATSLYAPQALKATHIPIPAALITSDLVSKGKPNPEPYLAGAKACGFDAKDCLVIEDAPSGIWSGKAAGATVLAVCTSHTRAGVLVAEPDYIVQDLTRVSARWVDGILELTIDETP